MTEKTDQTDQTEANRYPPLRATPHARALVQARARMSKAWARANEDMAEFFELDGRPEDAKEARKAAKAEWREAAKHDREALKLIESELRAGGVGANRARWRCGMSALTCPMAAAAEHAAAALAAAEQAAAALAAAEQRAEAAEREVARLRGAWAGAVAEVAAMGAEPYTTGQVLTERRSPATRAALREVTRMLAEAQPAEVADCPDGAWR